MPSVYDTDNYTGRVNLAVNYITRGSRTTRHFDTCFEMYDGNVVACALYRRAEKNPKLAANLPRYLNASLKDDTLAKYASIPTRNLADKAREVREACHASN